MRPRVLIVEDSALVVGALRILLEDRGFEVDASGGVADAIDTCRRVMPDVMLLDLGLRDGSGFEVLAQLERDGGLPRVVLALTGDDAPGIRERCLAAGCRDVLVKPIRPLELPVLLRELLEEG